MSGQDLDTIYKRRLLKDLLENTQGKASLMRGETVVLSGEVKETFKRVPKGVADIVQALINQGKITNTEVSFNSLYLELGGNLSRRLTIESDLPVSFMSSDSIRALYEQGDSVEYLQSVKDEYSAGVNADGCAALGL